MSRTCETCKHKGKNRPFCHDCWKDDARPYWKRMPEPEHRITEESLFYPDEGGGSYEQ